MSPRSPITQALVTILLAVPFAARAATPTDKAEERAKQEVVAKTPGQDKPVSLAAELGTALSRGNTQTLHLHTDARLTWVFAPRWVSSTVGRALYEQSKDTETANSWSIAERIDRFVSERVSLFAAVGVERDPFAGINRRDLGQLGVSFLVLERRDAGRDNLVTDQLSLEAGGYGAIEHRMIPQNSAEGTPPPDKAHVEILASRLAASYRHAFSTGNEVGASIEEIEDFVETANRVINSTVYVASALTKGLSIKLAATHRFDNKPATEDLKKDDVLITGGLVVSL